VRTGQPSGRQRVGLVQVHQFESAFLHQAMQCAGGPSPQAKPCYLVHGNPCFGGPNRQRGIASRQQLHLVPAFAQASQRQPRLALAAAPFALQVDIKRFHSRTCFPTPLRVVLIFFVC
jgi:hypothetical protein